MKPGAVQLPFVVDEVDEVNTTKLLKAAMNSSKQLPTFCPSEVNATVAVSYSEQLGGLVASKDVCSALNKVI